MSTVQYWYIWKKKINHYRKSDIITMYKYTDEYSTVQYIWKKKINHYGKSDSGTI